MQVPQERGTRVIKRDLYGWTETDIVGRRPVYLHTWNMTKVTNCNTLLQHATATCYSRTATCYCSIPEMWQKQSTNCNTLQQNTIATHYCNTLLQLATATLYCNTPEMWQKQCTSCNTLLQHTTATRYCNTLLQHATATHMRCDKSNLHNWVVYRPWMSHGTATHCNTLQHTATHCNTHSHTWDISTMNVTSRRL